MTFFETIYLVASPAIAIALCVSFFALGTAFGSFMEVVRTRESWRKALTGRSHCDGCKQPLRWYELIPLISFLCLRFRCPRCSAHISQKHFWAEFATALAFLLIFLNASTVADAVLWALIAIFAVPIVLSDLKTMEVPEHLSYTLAALTLVAVVLLSPLRDVSLLTSLINGLLLALPFFLIWLLSQGRAMGLGDAKVALPLGFTLATGIEIISVFFITFWIGVLLLTLYWLYIRLTTISTPLRGHSEVPLVPSIVLAYVVVQVWGITFLDIAAFLSIL